MHGSPRLPCDQQWGKIWSSSGMTGSRQNNKGHKCGCLLWLPSGYKPSERWLWLQRWKDKEVLEASKEKDGWPSSPVCSNPKMREQANQPSCQCCISGVHDIPSKVLSFFQLSPLIDIVNMHEMGFECDWTTPIVSYLRDGTLPDNKEAARKLKVQAAWFILVKNVLYKKGLSWPYLRCLSPEETDYVKKGSSWRDL